MLKIVFLDEITVTSGDLDMSGFAKIGEYIGLENTNKITDILNVLDGVDVIVSNKCKISAEDVDLLPSSVKLVATSATGYDAFDINALSARGIKFVNVPGYGTNAVAQLAFAFILNFASGLHFQANLVTKKGWSPDRLKIPMYELAGKTLGIIGLGDIGAKLAKMALAFDMRVIAYNRSYKEVAGVELVTLDEVARQSDFISLNLAMNQDTRHIISKEFLANMKASAFLINTARGGLIDEDALIKSLEDKQIAGAGLDVLTVEPFCSDNKLLKLANVILTSHIAWAPVETRQRCIDITIDNIINFFNDAPTNLIEV